jgi:hypothetical protein
VAYNNTAPETYKSYSMGKLALRYHPRSCNKQIYLILKFADRQFTTGTVQATLRAAALPIMQHHQLRPVHIAGMLSRRAAAVQRCTQALTKRHGSLAYSWGWLRTNASMHETLRMKTA